MTPRSTSSTLSGVRPVRVLVVDDSAVARQMLVRELSRDPDIEVIGSAPDAYVARDKIVKLQPDVLTLDVEMPRMDGITFLRKLMTHFPMPVIVVSSQTTQGTNIVVEALGAGAVEFVGKPGPDQSMSELAPILIEKIKLAARAKVRAIDPDRVATKSSSAPFASDSIFAIGASTGGVQALTEVLTAFGPDTPPTLIVQHMPARFTGPFAKRLNDMCDMEIREAVHGEQISPGTALIAPGGFHMLLRRTGTRYFVEVKDGPDVFHQKPSVEVLFNSVAKCAGPNAVGAMLTGMGSDGAQAMLRMRQAGAMTIAQDEASCVVFGMPGEAVKCGAVRQVVPLKDIAQTMIAAARSGASMRQTG